MCGCVKKEAHIGVGDGLRSRGGAIFLTEHRRPATTEIKMIGRERERERERERGGERESDRARGTHTDLTRTSFDTARTPSMRRAPEVEEKTPRGASQIRGRRAGSAGRCSAE